MNQVCPVCGYDELHYPPKDDMICPCCGTQFGYDDFAKTYEALRQEWLSKGAVWQSRRTPPPVGWSAERQLKDNSQMQVCPPPRLRSPRKTDVRLI